MDNSLKHAGIFCYDCIVVLGLFFILSLITVLFITHGAFGPGSLFFKIFLLLVYVGYHYLSLDWTEQTVGMRAWRVYLRSKNGERITSKQALLWRFIGCQRSETELMDASERETPE